ncbi:MAG TPA: hypothetical protein VJ725_26855 [Thermoanaerobaculia bacterium]|nr:hypothetical protein [Thermoanaerobaculia bacterium]
MSLETQSCTREPRHGARLAALAFLLAGLLAGPLAAGELRVVLEGQAGVTSDGNYGQVDQENEGQDYQSIGRAGLDLRLSYALERMNLALAYSPFYERNLDDGGEEGSGRASGTSHRLAFGLVGELTQRLTLSIQERLQKSPNLDLYQPVVNPDTIAVARRGDQLTHSLDVALDHALSRRSALTLGLTHGRRTYEESGLIDSESLGARVGAAWDLARQRRIDAYAGLSHYDYETDNEADVRLLGVGYARELGRDGQIRVEGGAWSVESRERFGPGGVLVDPDAEKETETGWRGGLQLSYGRELVRWSAGLSHDVSPGAGLGRAMEVDNLFLGLSTSLGRRWTFGVDGSASRQTDIGDRPFVDADGDGLDDFGNESFDTEFIAGSVRLGWNLAQRLRIDGGYSHIWQDAQGAGPFEDLSYDRFFLGVAVRLYSTGETPQEPSRLGEQTDEEPDVE